MVGKELCSSLTFLFITWGISEKGCLFHLKIKISFQKWTLKTCQIKCANCHFELNFSTCGVRRLALCRYGWLLWEQLCCCECFSTVNTSVITRKLVHCFWDYQYKTKEEVWTQRGTFNRMNLDHCIYGVNVILTNQFVTTREPTRG